MEEKKNKNLGKNRTWEEDIYWKHFHSVQFLQFLPANFHHHLTLPTKFSANEVSKLAQSATLKGPNGATWNVELLTDDSNRVMLSGDGWKEFVKVYSLRKNDLLRFKYDRTSKCFEVLIFDESNSCEREASYFVQKCGSPQSNGGTDGKVKSRLSYEPVVCSADSTAHTDNESDDESHEDECRKSSKNKSTLKVKGSTQKEVPSNQLRKRKSFTRISRILSFDEDEKDEQCKTYVEDKRTFEQQDSLEVNDGTSKKAHPHSAASDRNSDVEVLCKENLNMRKSPFVIGAMYYQSNRRPVTEAEKEEAYAKACRSATIESFIVIMRPSHVYRRFSLVIPQMWKPTAFSRNKNQEIFLRIKDRTWAVSYLASVNHGHGGIEAGWKRFAIDNFLEESDVCLFVPGGEDNKRFVLDVSIFRVVSEIIPVTPVT